MIQSVYGDPRAALERYGIDCAFEPSGMLEVATQPWHVEQLREWAQLHREHGHEIEWLDADEARERLNSTAILGAVRRPGPQPAARPTAGPPPTPPRTSTASASQRPKPSTACAWQL